ncbi:MAG TPA: hypothetical protein DCM87_04580 [Planctomycetes bacterium]|nr:hypothetical protein [Planctomycetota bacterium]
MNTNDCSIIEPLLGAYLDGELPRPAAERLDVHLAACEGCRAVLGELAETDRLLGADPIPMPTDREWAAVEWRLLARTRSVFAGRLVRTCALAAAAAVLLGALAWLAVQVFPSGGSTESPGGYTAQSGTTSGGDEEPLGISVEHGERF